MRYKSLDTNLLVMLDIMLEQVNITKTADILGLTQPAVSNALNRLREHFKDDLIVQIGRQNVLTPLATRLREPLKALLRQTDSLISMRSSFDPKTDDRQFSVVGSEYVGTFVINEVIRRVTREAPGVSISFRAMSDEAYEQFDRGEIDMLTMPQQYLYDDHPNTVLFEETYSCVVSIDHPRIADSMTIEEYVNERHAVRGMGPRARLPMWDERWLVRRGVHRKVAAEVPSFNEVGEVIVGTDLVGTVHTRLAQRMVRELPLKIVEVPLEIPPLVDVLHWHRHMDQDEGLAWLRKIFCDVAATL